jgi:hypothetical protein
MTNRTQTTSASTEQRQFVEHLEQASRIVQSWPMWKQTVLGNIGAQEACQPQSSQASGGPSTRRTTTSDSDQP